MKTFLMKVFLMFSAMACMFQGMMLLSVGLGRLSPQKLAVLYEQLFSLPSALKTIETIGAFFILLGFILLIFAARTKQVPKIMTVEQEGQSLNITYKTVIDFIEQVGSQDPYVTHFIADFINDPKEGIIIPIEIELNGVPSVHHVLSEMENTLRSEMLNVFNLKKLKFDFHVKGVSIDPKKKYFTCPATEKSPVPAAEKSFSGPLEVPLTVPQPAVPGAAHQADKRPECDLEENFAQKRTDEELEQLFEETKNGTKPPSLVSRILWGK